MPSLDDIPTLPLANLSGDDMIAVIDGSDRRSPRQATLAQLGSSIVNPALAADPAGARDAMEAPADFDLADFARGQHHLPLAVSRARQTGMFPGTNTPALSILGWGDSLGVQFSQLLGNLANAGLIRGVPFMGYKLMATDMYTVIAGSAALTFGADWLTGQYIAQAASTTLQWARSGNIPCNRISIAYLRGTGSSTVTLQYSQDGGSSWVGSATIDTSLAANEFNFAIYSLPGSRPTLVRTVTAAGHTIKLIGTGAWQGEEGEFNGNSGYTMICGARGGLDGPAGIIAPSPTMWSTIMSVAKVDLVISSWNDRAAEWDEGGSIETARARANAGRVADWVMVSGVSGESDDPGAPDAIDMQNQRVAMREWAIRENQNFIDWAGFLRDSWDYAVSIGVHSSGDSIHPSTPYGYRVRQAYVAEQLGRVLNASDGFVGNIATELGNGYRLRANQYGLLLESLSGYQNGITIAGPNGYLAMESATNSDPWRNLGFTYTGTESAGLTFGWTTNRQQGTPKTALQFAATGNSDATNLETVSSYPLVMTTRRVNATPSTPAAGSVKPFWRLNGSSKWEFCVVPPSGTVHIIWTEP